MVTQVTGEAGLDNNGGVDVSLEIRVDDGR